MSLDDFGQIAILIGVLGLPFLIMDRYIKSELDDHWQDHRGDPQGGIGGGTGYADGHGHFG